MREVFKARTRDGRTHHESGSLLYVKPGRLEAVARGLGIEWGDVCVREYGAARAEAEPRALGAKLRQQPGTDEDGITAPAERDFDHTHGAA